jgi:hypothetical protein
MVRSKTDNEKGTEPPKLTHKVWTVGSIPATDKDFLEWCKLQIKKRSTVTMMNLYVQQLNIENEVLHERQKKAQKEQVHSAETAEVIPAYDPAETFTASGTDGTPLNILDPQIIPSPTSLNISNPSPQNNISPPNLELPSQISPNLPPSDLLPLAAARTDQEQEQQRSEQNLNANNLTMSQALELFELLQSRRAADVVRPPTIEAHSPLFMNSTFINTMTRKFLKTEFVALCRTWGSDSNEWRPPLRLVQQQNVTTST